MLLQNRADTGWSDIMTYRIEGLKRERFAPLFGLSDAGLAARGAKAEIVSIHAHMAANGCFLARIGRA